MLLIRPRATSGVSDLVLVEDDVLPLRYVEVGSSVRLYFVALYLRYSLYALGGSIGP